MKKILLYLSEDTVDFNLDNPTCYDKLYEDFKVGGGNVGNKFFLAATKSYLEELDIENTVYYSAIKNKFFICNKSIDEINSSYRAIVLPQANIFSVSKEAIYHLKGFTSIINKIKIPVFVTGVGAQADSYDDLYKLYYSIRSVATEFCNAVYKTGGEFSLRGYFTKELFDLLGFRSAVVTGCPSIFQVGRDFRMSENKIQREKFRPIINGYATFLKNNMIYNAFKKYDAIYLDQGEYIRALYDVDLFQNEEADKRILYYLIEKYTIRGIQLLANDKIKLFYDIPVWRKYIVDEEFNFSFGQRIHGNIISIISGIPAMVKAEDTRTKEMAEYFNIPTISNIRKYNDIYDVYLDTDYSKFNAEFTKKFDVFNKFLLDYDLRQHDLQRNEDKVTDLSNWEFPKSINLECFRNVERSIGEQRWTMAEKKGDILQYIRLLPYSIKQTLLNSFYKNKYFKQH